ncbi:MAG: RNA polymerase sigma factor [Aurantimonas endophytica]|uniref:RNA polymerase sigma-70 factor (ECF subfamily) n=1 Tax=Aurantimonas endophytica TaxID=1522175 RepID=A0A7W6HHN5_9HYPH|nr:RNA polymerase sigma factor [Aurantimonas endophytica]MBB4005366.1 RNA polymerase sigma-70 factor (ECF subfamily) [Aurantimonas endophytica]MCO6405973.1 sigma-70 family RNA polymerase sigma factor [Aurantimonas endophytica]
MSEDEIARLVEPLIPGLRRYAYALVRDGAAADDLVQDCLERAVGRWYLRRADGDLRAWLYAILRNLHLSALRQDRRRGEHLGLDDMTEPPGVDGGQMERAEFRDVLAGLDALSEEHRTVLLLVGVEDLSYEETAKVMGLPLGTVMSRLSRARARLRTYLDHGVRPGLRRVK